MDAQNPLSLRIAPTTQQGGTQTIQQSIYLSHNNPCGFNLLIYVPIGLTGIRYIDLKNYLDTILNSEQMRILFNELRVEGTAYMNDPTNYLLQPKYIYAIQQWAQAWTQNLPVPVDYYNGYEFEFSVYDASGCAIYDSRFPNIKPAYLSTDGNYSFTLMALVDNPLTIQEWSVYKIVNNAILMAYIKFLPPAYPHAIELMFSDFIVNQSLMPETTMAVASLLIDSANTRTFGVPRYGFSSREGQTVAGGLTYNCCTVINVNSVNPNGKSTLIQTIFARLSLVQKTINIG